MTLITYDVETMGWELDATGNKFLLGSICTGQKTRIYYNKEEMWKAIIQIGKENAKNGKNTFAYALNAKYDFYNIWDYKELKKDENGRTRLTIINDGDPFYAKYYIYANGTQLDLTGKERKTKETKPKQIFFLDTLNIAGTTSVEKAGTFLGLRKIETPKALKDKNKTKKEDYTEKELKEIGEYCKRDAKITFKLMKFIKKAIREDGYNRKLFISTGQLAISSLISLIKTKDYSKALIKETYKKTTDFITSYGIKDIGINEEQEKRIKEIIEKTEKQERKERLKEFLKVKQEENQLKEKIKEIKKENKELELSQRETTIIKQIRPELSFNQRMIADKIIRGDIIRKAYKGGRKQAFQIGLFENATKIDLNGSYGYSATQIKIPDLRTERYVKEPLSFYSIKELIDLIGVSKVLMKLKEDKIGLFPLDYYPPETESFRKQELYFPKWESLAIGTITHLELRKLIKEGNKLLGIEESVIYTNELIENPVGEIMKQFSDLKKKDNIRKDIYKGMITHGVGKLGQMQNTIEYDIKDIEEIPEMKKKGYEVKAGIGTNALLKKETNKEKSRWFCPIIPAYINSHARINLYENLQKIEEKDLLYCVTDSISFINKEKYIKRFKIGEELGEWKIEEDNETAEIKGKDTYRIGEKIRMAGTRITKETKEEWEKGIINNYRMMTLRRAITEKKDLTRTGEFTNWQRNLKEMEYKSRLKLLRTKEPIYICEREDQEWDYFKELIQRQAQENDIFK